MLSTSGAIAFFVFIALVVFFLSTLTSMAVNSFFKRDTRHLVLSTSLIGTLAFFLCFVATAYSLGPILRWRSGAHADVSMEAWKLLTLLSTMAALVCMISWQVYIHLRRSKIS